MPDSLPSVAELLEDLDLSDVGVSEADTRQLVEAFARAALTQIQVAGDLGPIYGTVCTALSHQPDRWLKISRKVRNHLNSRMEQTNA